MKEIAELMKKARIYLKGAERDFNTGDYFLSVSRCYYSMFTAARALLLKKGIAPKTHKGTIKKFGEEYIKTGVFPEELGKAYSYVESLREISDYGTSINDIDRKDAEKALSYANKFVSEAEKYLEREGHIGKEHPPTTEEKLYAILQSGTQYEIDGDYVKLIRVDKPVRCDICGKTVEQGEMLAVKERLGGGRYRTKYYCGDEYALEKRAVEKGTGRIVEREKIKDFPHKEREKYRSLGL